MFVVIEVEIKINEYSIEYTVPGTKSNLKNPGNKMSDLPRVIGFVCKM